MVGLIRSAEWSETPLGDISGWPRSLKDAIGVCLDSAFPSFVWWGEDLIQFYNDASLDILRTKHPEAFAKPAKEAWSEVWPEVGHLVEGVIETGRAVRGDDVAMDPERNGGPERAYFTFSYGPLRDGEGRVAGVYVTAIETTARVRAERELRRSEERLSLALRSGRMGDWSLDLATGEATRSPLHDRIFGYEEMLPEWTYEKFLGHIHPEDRERVSAAFERSRETGEDLEFECRIVRADGAVRWIWALGTIQRGTDRPRMFGLVNDITGRKNAEAEVRRSEERFRLLFEQATDAAFVHDLEGRFIQVNERACESLGYTREELLSMKVSDVEQNLVPGGFAELWTYISRTGLPKKVEGVHRRKDGSTFPVEVNVGRFEGGEGRAILALVRDLTGRKRAESEREAALERERRARRQISFLADASRRLASFLDLEESLERTARLVVPRVAEWCVVDVLEEDSHEHRLAVSFQREDESVEVLRQKRPDEEAPEPVREVIRSGEPRLVESVDEEHLRSIATSEEHLQRLRRFGLESYVITPLTARGRTFGTITFARNDPARRYDEESLSLLLNFSDRAALAIENSRLYGRQRHTAKVLQESLLPAEIPAVPGLEVAARFEPLGEGVEVGGDFYDLFEASEGRWSVVVGDVLGKGPEAASLTSLVRHTLRRDARAEESPSAVLGSLNAAMLEEDRDGKFCTVLHANVRPDSGGFELEFASGGHPLPIVLRDSGEAEEAGRHGTLLGVYDDPEFFDSKVRLGPGDTVVLYTDGVTEARREGEIFGEERVVDAVAACAGRSAEGIAEHLEKKLREFSGGELEDDAAILVARVVEWDGIG